MWTGEEKYNCENGLDGCERDHKSDRWSVQGKEQKWAGAYLNLRLLTYLMTHIFYFYCMKLYQALFSKSCILPYKMWSTLLNNNVMAGIKWYTITNTNHYSICYQFPINSSSLSKCSMRCNATFFLLKCSPITHSSPFSFVNLAAAE